jgi:lysophospholipase L1-like esterase
MKFRLRSAVAAGLWLLFVLPARLTGAEPAYEAKPDHPFFQAFAPRKAPAPAGLVLREGDRLAICGDSITEQRMYSRIIETYLTVCVPELKITTRQFGWSGETAPGFLARMTNDVLRFQPTLATTCYGMNDHGYRRYEAPIGAKYREAMTAIVRAFTNAGARVILGSPGCVGPKVAWTKATQEEMNLNLCELRNLGIEIAQAEGVGFADVFWPMLKATFFATQRYGDVYQLPGKDGVHPDWAGSFVMAYSFLKAMGLNGGIGTITADLQAIQASATPGHVVDGFADGELRITSQRYPFCATGEINKDTTIRSGMTLVPFNAELNRFLLVVTNAAAPRYIVTWGSGYRSYTREQLAKGVNLAEDFALNPFSAAFDRVDAAVAAKQAYETRQVKTLMHGDEGRADREATVALTEKARQFYVEALAAAMVPVTHTIKITAQSQ